MAAPGVGHAQSGTPAPSSTTPNPQTIDQFKSSLTAKSDQQLIGMLDDPKLTSEQKKAVADELANRLSKPSSSADKKDGEEEEDLLTKLLKKLKRGEPLTPQEKQQLTDALRGMKMNDGQIDTFLGQFGSNAAPPNAGDIQ